MIDIEAYMQRFNKSLTDTEYGFKIKNNKNLQNQREIEEEKDFNVEELKRMVVINCDSFNKDQKQAYNQIVDAVENNTGQSFFIHAPGGMYKCLFFVYIWNVYFKNMNMFGMFGLKLLNK